MMVYFIFILFPCTIKLFRIKVVEGLYYQCSKNKGADQLRGYREADLRLNTIKVCHVYQVLSRPTTVSRDRRGRGGKNCIYSEPSMEKKHKWTL